MVLEYSVLILVIGNFLEDKEFVVALVAATRNRVVTLFFVDCRASTEMDQSLATVML